LLSGFVSGKLSLPQNNQGKNITFGFVMSESYKTTSIGLYTETSSAQVFVSFSMVGLNGFKGKRSLRNTKPTKREPKYSLGGTEKF